MSPAPLIFTEWWRSTGLITESSSVHDLAQKAWNAALEAIEQMVEQIKPRAIGNGKPQHDEHIGWVAAQMTIYQAIHRLRIGGN